MWFKRVEVFTNIVLLLAGISVLTLSAGRLRTPQRMGAPYKVGDVLRETAEMKFGSATYILNTQSRCHFCTESMPFYKRLIESGARVIAVSQEPPEVNRKYLDEHGVHPADVLSAKTNGLVFRGTPSVLLVDARGIVRSAWWGKQDALGEAEMLKGGQK